MLSSSITEFLFFKAASLDEGGNEWTSGKPWRNSTKPSYPEKAHSTGPHRDAGGGINVSSHRARWRKKGISGAGYACRHCFSPSNVLFGNSAGSPRNHCSRLEGNWLLDETALLSHKSSVTIQFDSLRNVLGDVTLTLLVLVVSAAALVVHWQGDTTDLIHAPRRRKPRNMNEKGNLKNAWTFKILYLFL